jgi:hypothetical protein
MGTLENNNEVAIIEKSVEIFKTAPGILITNQQRSAKAVAVGKNILEAWEQAWAITNEDERIQALAAIDERSNNFLANCTKALKEEKEVRAVITQLMTEVAKWFTAAENEIDKSKAGTVPEKIQTQRNSFAKVSFEISERKRQEAERAAAKSREEVEIRSAVESHISNCLIGALGNKKQAITNAFNAITLETIEAKGAGLKGMATSTSIESLQEMVVGNGPVFRVNYHDVAEFEAIANSTKANYNWDTFQAQWESEIEVLKLELIDKLPSKLSELQEQKRLADEAAKEQERQRIAEEQRQKELAAANDKQRKELEEKQRIEREQEAARREQMRLDQEAAAEAQRKREAEEAEKLAQQQEEARLKAEQEAEIKKQGEQTMVLFEQEAALAETVTAPEARQGYDIEILHPAAWVQIFQLWFENEGKGLAIDKIGNTKMDQMKTWAEKHAHKNDVKIESKFLKYNPSFTAVNRKSK